jgi:hypothetical protein
MAPEMIEITLSQRGNMTDATCSIAGAGGVREHFRASESSGAKALTSLVEKLAAAAAGTPWRVLGDPALSGVVPSKRYRKGRTKRERPAFLPWMM